MQEELGILKERGLLERKFMQRMQQAWQEVKANSKNELLPYPNFRRKISRSFQITRFEAMEALKELEKLGLVSIHKRGIKLNYTGGKNGR